LERFGYSDGIESYGRFYQQGETSSFEEDTGNFIVSTQTGYAIKYEDVVEATTGPPHMAGLPHARVRRLGSSYRRDVSMSKTSHDACQISRIGWAWEWGLGC
jgi:hypothetical protein